MYKKTKKKKENEKELGQEISLDLKSISFSTEEVKQETDYKKMSIGQLRKIIQDKGFVTDSSKLKKNEILKMLESSE